MIEIITGDIFESKEKYLLHQCNCVSKRAAHLAKDVFAHYPYSDIYASRKDPDQPGTILITGNGKDQRYIVALFGQYYPGAPRFPSSSLDGTEIREKYFHRALIELSKIPNLESVAVPYRIGCGAAGGNWEIIYGIIENFAKYVEKAQGAKVVIYQRECDR